MQTDVNWPPTTTPMVQIVIVMTALYLIHQIALSSWTIDSARLLPQSTTMDYPTLLVMNLMTRPLGIVHMSFTTAKTLMIALQGAMESLETKIKQPILSMDEILDKKDEQIDL